MKKENKSTHKHQADAIIAYINKGKKVESDPKLWGDKADAIIFWCGNCKSEFESKR